MEFRVKIVPKATQVVLLRSAAGYKVSGERTIGPCCICFIVVWNNANYWRDL